MHLGLPWRQIWTSPSQKMIGETPEVGSDKRKPREDRQNHRYRYNRYHRYHRKSTYIGRNVQNLKKLPDMRIIAHHNVKSSCQS